MSLQGKQVLIAVLTGALTLAGMVPATAQNYPNRPVKMIVPFSPGGSSDLTARLLAKGAEKYLGQPVVIENKPGAGAMLGLNELVSSKPDGYTIGITNSGMVTQPLYGNARFNYPVDLQALAQVGEVPFCIAVAAEAPWKTLEEFIKYAQENPGKIKYGITGFGNTAHIGPEHLKLEAKFKMDAVNFDGGAPLIAAMLGGHIQAAGINPVDIKEHIKAGRIRMLVVFGEKRLTDPLFADVPTAREKGYPVVVTLWQGIGGPKNMPEDVKKKLNDAFGKIINEPEMQTAIRNLGLEPAYLDANGFAKRWVSDQERIKKIVTDTGILEIVKSQTAK